MPPGVSRGVFAVTPAVSGRAHVRYNYYAVAYNHGCTRFQGGQEGWSHSRGEMSD